MADCTVLMWQVLYCNIGNPQSVGQKPITFYRQVAQSVCECDIYVISIVGQKSHMHILLA